MNDLNLQAQARGAAARTQLLAVANRPVWNILGGGLNTVEGHLFGPPLSFWLDDDEDETPACGYTVTDQGIAVIPIIGTLVDSEPSWWMSYLGYCSIPQIARSVNAAHADGNVKDIFLQVHSPGGHVSGLAAACDAVWAVRQAGQKRICAGCSMVASAAYEIASQCDKMYLSPDGMGGCLGTVYVMADWSGYYSQMGIVMLRITSDGGEAHKGQGARGTKITAAQQADYKRLCNEYRRLFNGVVQRGRGFSDEVINSLTDGRIHVGANALQLSLVDGIATPEAVLSALGGGDDLDDLAGRPDQTAPDTDEDDEASDTHTNPILEENFPLSTQNQDKDQAPGWFTNFFANGNGTKTPETPETPAPAAQDEHPVLKAALAAGLDTPEKLTALVEGSKARQEADDKAAKQALEEAQISATNAAVTAFGQDSEGLKAAKSVIAAQTSVAALQSLTGSYKAATPANIQGGKRQTAAPASQNTDNGTGQLDDTGAGAKNTALNPSTIYNKRRGAK